MLIFFVSFHVFFQMEVASFILLKCEQSRYYLEVHAITTITTYDYLLPPMQINSARELCENLVVNFLQRTIFTNVFMEMSNNIHNININLHIVTSNYSPIRFRIPQLPAAVSYFPMGVHFKSFYKVK